MAGVGKSAVARRVAARLGTECIDLDAEISAARGGQSVASIFDEIGEDQFRLLETEALIEALDRTRPAVIATGGGIVERSRNVDLLRRRSCVVWLSAPDDVIAARLRASSVRRPLLDGDLEANVRRLRARREALYRGLADIAVDVGDADLGEVVDLVLDRCREVWPPAADSGALR
ncbi:MAG: AAA family ATPase [Actinobacteria bacterium]|nr:AAA family ATPase [Actinomycetota bacterium]